jgi:hypothetical protein
VEVVAVTALSLLAGAVIFAALGYLFEGVRLPLPRPRLVALLTLVLLIVTNVIVLAQARAANRQS